LKGKIMFKQTLVAVALFGTALAASAGENPLQPSFARYNAALSFAAASADVSVAPTPLTPSYFQWNVAASANAQAPMIVENNPLQPGFKRS
jgi:hypothetical protein